MLYKHIPNIEGLSPWVLWRTLLYSGSGGNLLFITKSKLYKIVYEKRYAAKTWQTSDEIFKTTHVGNLDMMFRAFSRSKIFSICADIGIVDRLYGEPVFDLILGINTLAKFGTALDFQEKNDTN